MMPKIKIDDLEFNTEDFDETTTAVFRRLQYTQNQLNKLEKKNVNFKGFSTYTAQLKEMIETNNDE